MRGSSGHPFTSIVHALCFWFARYFFCSPFFPSFLLLPHCYGGAPFFHAQPILGEAAGKHCEFSQLGSRKESTFRLLPSVCCPLTSSFFSLPLVAFLLFLSLSLLSRLKGNACACAGCDAGGSVLAHTWRAGERRCLTDHRHDLASDQCCHGDYGEEHGCCRLGIQACGGLWC